MARKRLNPRRAKIHRNYSFEEIARLFGVHKQTVRNWQKEGLSVLTAKRPYLVLGRSLRTFLD
jgi:DNA-binding transcriptional MerR regulator